MAADLALLSSLTQLHHHHSSSSSQQNQPTMWNPTRPTSHQEDDDSWEVRAFEEDTGNVMGTTWPPRSYTCTFCRREFRSAQALGGHMNVHRRDRARLHQTHLPLPDAAASINPSTSSSTFLIPTHEFSTNGGLCLLYQLPNPNNSASGVFTTPAALNGRPINSPSTLLSVSPYPPNNLIAPPVGFPIASPEIHSSNCYTSKHQPDSNSVNGSNKNLKEVSHEEVDLELRLGQKITASTSSSSSSSSSEIREKP